MSGLGLRRATAWRQLQGHRPRTRGVVMIRRVAVAVLAIVTMAAGGALADIGPAQADPGTHGCVTRHEYRELQRGQSWDRVKQITGANGTLVTYDWNDQGNFIG